MKPKDILDQNFPPSILIYGLAGCGKTALVSQLSNAYLFDFDRGMRTAATLRDRFFVARQSIEFDEYRDENPKKPTMYQKAMKKLLDFVGQSSKDNLPYDAIVLDSLTGMCRAAQLQIQSLSDKSNPMGDPLAHMEIQNWGSLITEVERFLTLLRAMRRLTVVTAHVDTQEVKKPGGTLGETMPVVMHPASATSKHGIKKLMWLFDEVLYADARLVGAGKINYRVTGKPPDNIIQARTRSGVGLVVHNEIGMLGLLKQMNYRYGEKDV